MVSNIFLNSNLLLCIFFAVFFCILIFIFFVLRTYLAAKNIETHLVEKPPDFSKFPTFELTQIGEQQVNLEPKNLELRSDLIRAYVFQYPDKKDVVQLVQKHVEWLVSNSPESQIYYVEWKMHFVERTNEQIAIINKWKVVVEKNINNSVVIRNAGFFSLGIDNLLSISCFQRCIDLNPLSPQALAEYIYACTFLENIFFNEMSLKYQRKLDKYSWTESDFRAILIVKEKIGIFLPQILFKPILFFISVINYIRHKK